LGPQVDDLIEPYIGYIAIGIPVVFISALRDPTAHRPPPEA